MAPSTKSTLTFLFTDIEGSTSLVREYPDATPSFFAGHNQILSEAIASHNGQVFRIVGDAFCATFPTARDALDAALAAQHRLQEGAPGNKILSVRMGVHTGVASPGDMKTEAGSSIGYLTLARVQRIMSSASGGQILLSSTTAELLRGQLPQEVTLRDVGEHHLKGFGEAEHLWQVIAPGLAADFPPVQSLRAFPNNLPVPLTTFIGREREVREIKDLLRHARLVTLTGPGGTGKTRLSIQVAADTLPQYENGAWFVEFASLTDPSLVPQAVAASLGIREQPGRAVLSQLFDYLSTKKLLLGLDNCEHLTGACAQLADALLHRCPELRLIATSREALGIAGEESYPVPPLRVPGLSNSLNPSDLLEYESIRLFIERARAVQPHFELNGANASAVTQICHRLDGIPLAIELAAARVKLFTPEQVAARLDDRFRLLTGGSRTALPRQQTLQALIEWSYDLLSAAESALFRYLSVFAGGWTFDAAETVCGLASPQARPAPSDVGKESNLDVLDALGQLVNKSLVVADQQGDEMRFRFLETIRQYAYGKLQGSGEAEAVSDRHLDYYLAFAERVEPLLHGPEQAKWLDRLEVEADNFRAAFDWAVSSEHGMKVLQLAGALWWFWYIRDHFAEAKDRLSAALACTEGNDPTDAKLRVMNGLGFIYYANSKIAESQAVLRASARLSEKLRSRRSLAESLQFLGAAEFVAVTQSGGGDYANVRQMMEKSLALWQELEDKTGISWELNLLASVAEAEGNLAQARAFWEQSVALRRVVGDPFLLGYSLRRLAEIALQQGDYAAAEASYREAHSLLMGTGGQAGIAAGLVGFAGLAVERGQVIRGVRLLAAIDALLKVLAWRLPPADKKAYEQYLAKARGQLTDAFLETAWHEGLALSTQEAIDYALNSDATG